MIKEKNQSISHIYATHPDEIFLSMYNYINLGVFSVRNIDLKRKVKYKKRKESNATKVRRETAIRKGRTYKDYLEYMSKNPDASVVEMDTVEGIKGGKVFLTILFRNSRFMLIFLMDNKNMECVNQKFELLQNMFGKELYSKIFEVVLTDNGSEFFNPTAIEKYLDSGKIVSRVFYCDPNASWQKGAIEKNHEFIRYVLPKGSSFDELNQETINILMSNINNTCRDILNGNTPFEVVKQILSDELIEKTGNIKIEPTEVNLSPNLLKRSDPNELE